MKQQLPRIQDEEFPGRLHTQSKKIKFGSKDRGIPIATENFHKKTPKHSPLAESDILKHIDSKLEQHKRDIEQRNDMILTIEKGFESVRQELTREKLLGEEKNRQLAEIGQQYQAAQAKLKISSEFKPQPNDKDKERISQLELSLKTLTAREHQLVQNTEQLTAQVSDMGQKCKSKEDIGDDSKKLKDAIRKFEEKSYKSQILIEELKKTLDVQSQEKALIKKQMEQLKSEFASKEQCLSSELTNNGNKVKELQKDKTSLLEQQKKLPNLQEQNAKLQEQINQLKQQLGEHTKQKDKELLQFKNNADTQSKNIDQLNLQIEDHKQKIENTTKQINDKQNQFEQVTKGKGQQENLLKEQQIEIKQLNQKIEELKTKNQQKPKNLELIQETIALLEKTDKEIQKGLSCTYCNKFIKQPVTIIPCGHSYCFECKKGYQKECSKCGPKLKIEAMYRNELLDDIIEMVKLVEQSIITMKQNTQNN